MNDTLVALAGEAFICHQNGQLSQASALYKRVLRLMDLPVIRNNLGKLLANSDRHRAALVQYEQALALKPAYAEGVQLGFIAL